MSDSCDLMDCSLLGFSIQGIHQARILEWVTISFSRGSSWPRDWTWVSCTAGRFSTDWAVREALTYVFCPYVARHYFQWWKYTGEQDRQDHCFYYLYYLIYLHASSIRCGTQASCRILHCSAPTLWSWHADSGGAAPRLSCSAAWGILVPWPGIKPVCPVLQGGFLTIGPPGKSWQDHCFNGMYIQAEEIDKSTERWWNIT